MIAQANAGIRLAEGVWLDLGILPSHIGYESTFSLDNEIYTRVLMAENSPYYETGAQLTAAISEKASLICSHPSNKAKSVWKVFGLQESSSVDSEELFKLYKFPFGIL